MKTRKYLICNIIWLNNIWYMSFMHNKRQTCELDYVNQSFSYTHDIIIQDNTYKNVDSRITSFCYANFCGKWKYFVLFTHDWIHGEMVCRINAPKSDYTVDLLSLCSIYWKEGQSICNKEFSFIICCNIYFSPN